jgi:hypothetical protein
MDARKIVKARLLCLCIDTSTAESNKPRNGWLHHEELGNQCLIKQINQQLHWF